MKTAHVAEGSAAKLVWSECGALRPQTYYKLSYVDRRINGVEQRICEDIPKLCDELGELVREWCNWCGRHPSNTSLIEPDDVMTMTPSWASSCASGATGARQTPE